MKKLFCLTLLAFLPVLAYGQFNDIPESVPEETIYPDENYEMEMSDGELPSPDLMYPAAESAQLQEDDQGYDTEEYYSDIEE